MTYVYSDLEVRRVSARFPVNGGVVSAENGTSKGEALT
jgi:hypothetical protein